MLNIFDEIETTTKTAAPIKNNSLILKAKKLLFSTNSATAIEK